MDYLLIALIFLGFIWFFVGRAAHRLEFQEGLDSYRAGVSFDTRWTNAMIEGWVHGWNEENRTFRVKR